MRAKINKLFGSWKYLLIYVVLGLVPVIWFWGKKGILIDGVDTNFPLNPLVWFSRRFFVWNNTLNAGVDFSSSIAGFFFHLIQVIPYSLGLGLQTVQLVSLLFWFLLIVFSSYFFVRTILPRKYLLQLLFVILYSFNIYLFNSWENIKVANLSMVSAIPLALLVLTRLKEGKLRLRRALFYSALIGIVVSGAGINPAYFLVLFIILFIYLVGLVISENSWSGIKKRCWEFLCFCLIIVLVNSFWLIPTIYYIVTSITPGGSLQKIGFPNWVNSLSENTSLLNVLRMQGAWDWYSFDQTTGLPLYIPYALNFFYKLPFIVFSFLIPLVALLSFLFRNKEKNYLYVSFGLMLIIGVFLGAGTHPPSGYVFTFLLEHVPFFNLFRSPWYIFTPLVCLSTAGLVVLFFASLDKMLEKSKLGFVKYFGSILALIIIVGNLFYCYPLVTGKIFRPGDKKGFYVRFPAYLFETEKWLTGARLQERVVEYPNTDLIEFTWGYRGIESILNLFSNVENLIPPLNTTESNIAKLVDKYYLELNKGAIEASQNIAHKIGAGYLFEKRDVETLALALPKEITELPNTSFSDTWFFYKILDHPTQKLYFANQFILSDSLNYFDEIMPIISPQTVLLYSKDDLVQGTDVLFKDSGRVILSENSQVKEYLNFSNGPSKLVNRFISRDLKKVEYSVDISENGLYQPVLEKYLLEEFGISKDKNLDVSVDGKLSSWKVASFSDSYVYFDQINLDEGRHIFTLNLENNNLISGGDFQGKVSFKEGGFGEGKVNYTISISGNNKYLDILNTGKAEATAEFFTSSFYPLLPYYIELKYKQIYGNNAEVLVGQNNLNTLIKTQVERFPNYPEWNVFGFYYDPVKTNSVLKIALSAPYTNDPLGTKVLYDDLVVNKVFTNNLLFIKNSLPKIALPEFEYEKISPVKYRLKVSKASGPHVLIFSENYSPEWKIAFFGKKPENFLAKHFSANYYANAWYLENTPDNYELIIYYRPQILFNLGVGISVLVFGLLIVLNLMRGYYEKKY